MRIHTLGPLNNHLAGLLLAASLLVISGHANAAICHVTSDAPGGGTGMDWINSPMTLQEALGSSTCTEIWVKAGVYKPGSAPSDHFSIGPGVAVYGGFAGTDTETLRAQRDPALHVTVLSGDIDTNDAHASGDQIDLTTADIAGANSLNVVVLADTTGAPITASTVIDGFTITGGEYPTGAGDGGGLFCRADGAGSECSPTISHVTFSGNLASFGGALAVLASDGATANPTLSNVTFSGNSAGFGGALYVSANTGGTSNAVLYNVTFSDNHGDTQVTSVPLGGAMRLYGAGATLYNVTFSGNGAAIGGAIFSDLGAAVLELHDVILWGNTSTQEDNRQITTNSAAQTIIDHSVVQGAFPGGTWDADIGTDAGGNTQADPQLGALGNHGGSTPTFVLGAGSSAIDAGSDRCLTDLQLAADQRGMARPQGLRCDIGATEAPYAVTLTIGSVSGAGSVSAAATPVPLGGAISACDGTGNCSADYAQHALVQLTATPATQSVFVGWTGDCAGTGIHFNVLMDAAKTCNATFAVDPDAALTVALDDGRAYAQLGDWLTYAISINNFSSSNASAIAVDDTLPTQLDGATATWQCMPIEGATCAASGTGNLTDTINLPAHSGAVYVLTARLATDASDVVENTVGVSGASGTITASHPTTIVIFRNGFDGNDSVPGLVRAQPHAIVDSVSTDQSVPVRMDLAHSQGQTQTLAATADGSLRVEAIRVGKHTWLRLVTYIHGAQQHSVWSTLRDGYTAVAIGFYRDAAGTRHLRMTGTQATLALPAPTARRRLPE